MNNVSATHSVNDHEQSDQSVDQRPTGINYASVSGINGPFPAELAGWNWGAFFFTWIWGIGHNVWISLLAFLPFLNVIMPFVLGFKGNEWAWQHRKFASVNEFKKTENAWKKWGFGLLIFIVLFYILMIAAVVAMFSLRSNTSSVDYDNTRMIFEEQASPTLGVSVTPTDVSAI